LPRQILQSTSRSVDARGVLAPARKGFAPTPEMPEIVEALTLLERMVQGGSGADKGWEE
jgi:hypothetical protein